MYDALKYANQSLKSRYIGNLFVIYRRKGDYRPLAQSSDNPYDADSYPYLTVGPHWYGAIFTLVVIYAAVSLFFHVIRQIPDRSLSSSSKLTLMVIEISLALLTTYFFLRTVLLDPGKLACSWLSCRSDA
jgi:antibiotic biosynthesis monooxygenase (ABM) superfamily enzyme